MQTERKAQRPSAGTVFSCSQFGGHCALLKEASGRDAAPRPGHSLRWFEIAIRGPERSRHAPPQFGAAGALGVVLES